MGKGTIYFLFGEKFYSIDNLKRKIAYSSNIPFESIIGLYVSNGYNYHIDKLKLIDPPAIYVKITELYN